MLALVQLLSQFSHALVIKFNILGTMLTYVDLPTEEEKNTKISK